MMYGLIDQKIHEYYTYMSMVFSALGNVQKDYNWLISDCVCYPKSTEINDMLNQEYCWMSGDELTRLIEGEDFQWIWGCLCGFEKEIPLDDILLHPIPLADGYDDYYHNPVVLQHPLSSIEIVPSDSSWLLLISKDKSIITRYLESFPNAEDLFEHNKQHSII